VRTPQDEEELEGVAASMNLDGAQVPRDHEVGVTSRQLAKIEDTSLMVVIVSPDLALIQTGCTPTTCEEVILADMIAVAAGEVVGEARAIRT